MQELCLGCGSIKNNLLFKSESYTLMQCAECCLVWKQVEGAGAELSKKVNEELFSNVDKRVNVKANKKMAAERMKFLSRFIKKGNLLEIGCATGEFLEEASSKGLKASGVDMSKTYVEYAQKKGLDVFCGRIEDTPKDKGYDVVAMFHLIEHILHPLQFLNEVSKIIKKDGLLYIITPNIKSSTNKLFGYKHSVYQHPDHYLFYSEKTLRDILSKCGFEVIQASTKEYHHHVFTSIKGYLGSMVKKNKTQGLQKNMVEKESSRSNVKKQLASLPNLLGHLFYPLLLPYSYLVSKRMKGHELIILAKKL